MNELLPSRCVIGEDQKLTYAGMYVLKKMDLKPKDGGMTFSIHPPSELIERQPCPVSMYGRAIPVKFTRARQNLFDRKHGLLFRYLGTNFGFRPSRNAFMPSACCGDRTRTL